MTGDRDPRDEQLDELIARYLQAVEVGAAPDRDALFARHPDLADALREFFREHDTLRQEFRFRGDEEPLKLLCDVSNASVLRNEKQH